MDGYGLAMAAEACGDTFHANTPSALDGAYCLYIYTTPSLRAKRSNLCYGQ